MLSNEAKRQVEQSSPTKKLSFVVSVYADDVLAEVRSMQDVQQRSSALMRLYKAAKEPFLSAVDRYQSLKIVDSLDGTPNLLLAGPAGTWKRLLKEQASVSTDPRFEILPNTPDWATTS